MLVPKLIHDFTGHYNRFDIFSLHVNTTAPPAVAFVGADAAARAPAAGENAESQAAPSGARARLGYGPTVPVTAEQPTVESVDHGVRLDARRR